jgi:hypothetical protein
VSTGNQLAPSLIWVSARGWGQKEVWIHGIGTNAGSHADIGSLPFYHGIQAEVALTKLA